MVIDEVRLDLRPVTAVFRVVVRGVDLGFGFDTGVWVRCLDEDEPVLTAGRIFAKPDHAGLTVNPGDDDNPVGVPRQQRSFRPDPEVVVNSADRFASATERFEEFDQGIGGHAVAVVSNSAPVDALGFDGLPLDAELDVSGRGF